MVPSSSRSQPRAQVSLKMTWPQQKKKGKEGKLRELLLFATNLTTGRFQALDVRATLHPVPLRCQPQVICPQEWSAAWPIGAAD